MKYSSLILCSSKHSLLAVCELYEQSELPRAHAAAGNSTCFYSQGYPHNDVPHGAFLTLNSSRQTRRTQL